MTKVIFTNHEDRLKLEPLKFDNWFYTMKADRNAGFAAIGTFNLHALYLDYLVYLQKFKEAQKRPIEFDFLILSERQSRTGAKPEQYEFVLVHPGGTIFWAWDENDSQPAKYKGALNSGKVF